MIQALTAAEIIARLDLKPHPEGGHYRETFRDTAVDANGRASSTAIYFLLARGERSHWHRIDTVEIWHYYAGHALALHIAEDGDQRSLRLGPDLAAGEMTHKFSVAAKDLKPAKEPFRNAVMTCLTLTGCAASLHPTAQLWGYLKRSQARY